MPPFRLPVAVICAAALLAMPAPVRAQKAAFSQAVADLAAATAASGAARHDRVRNAIERMERALPEWDRDLAAMEARLASERPAAPPAQAIRLHVSLALEYVARGRFDDAIRALEAARALDPAISDVRLLLGLTLDAAGRPGDAAAAFAAAWSLDAGNPMKAYYALRRPEALGSAVPRAHAALIDVTARVPSPAAAPPFMTVGLIADAFASAVVVGDAATGDGFALLRAARYADAVAALRHGVTGGGEAGNGGSPRAAFDGARSHEAAGRVAEARRDYERALAGTLSGRHVLHVGLARLAQVEGDLDAAIRHFAEAARLHPNEPYIHKELASAYVASGRPDEALRELAAALLIDPRDADAHAAIGQLHLESGRAADAVAALTRALELNPERLETRYALGTALMRLGRTSAAAQEFAAFRQASQQALERRRRGIAEDVERQRDVQRGGPAR